MEKWSRSMELLWLIILIFLTIFSGLLVGKIIGYCLIKTKDWWNKRKYKKSVTPFHGTPCSIKLEDKDIIELEMLPDSYFSFGRMSESWQFTYDNESEEDDDDEKNLFSANYKINKTSTCNKNKKWEGKEGKNNEKWIGNSKSGQSFL
uniref:Uncharacterized protein n=1 Tax=Parastrongyloides trichosuri TaxID=131310 RepID=A0A0N4Z186_PARTI